RSELRVGSGARLRRTPQRRVSLEPAEDRALRDGDARRRHGMGTAEADLAPGGSARRPVLSELLRCEARQPVRQGCPVRRRGRRALWRLPMALLSRPRRRRPRLVLLSLLSVLAAARAR